MEKARNREAKLGSEKLDEAKLGSGKLDEVNELVWSEEKRQGR